MANPRFQELPLGWVPVSNRVPSAALVNYRFALARTQRNPGHNARFDFRNGGAAAGEIVSDTLLFRGFGARAVTVPRPQYGGYVREVATNGNGSRKP